MSHRAGRFLRSGSIVDARGHFYRSISFFLATQQHVPPKNMTEVFSTRSMPGAEAAFIADTKCLSSRRTRSVFRRAGSFFRSITEWTREGAFSVPQFFDFCAGGWPFYGFLLTGELAQKNRRGRSFIIPQFLFLHQKVLFAL